MSKYDETGHEYSFYPVFPFKMRFEADISIRDLIPNTEPSDHMAYTSQLEGIPANSTLYKVYGLDAPDGVEHMIGHIRLDGQLTKSKWGDENLFFRHQLSSEDMYLKPDWKPHYAKFNIFGHGSETEGAKCPYMEMLKSLYE